jgi:hypothetical protein
MAASGGAGRSTVAGLVADALAGTGHTLVLDTGRRLASPWPDWVAEHPGGGLATLPPYQPLTSADVRGAVSHRTGPDGMWQVLTDHRSWQSAPLGLPTEPEAWYQLASLGAWQAVVVDTDPRIADDIVTARSGGRAGLTARWCHLPYAIPLLTTMSTGAGLAAAQTAVMAAEADGLPLRRTVMVVSSPAAGRLPATVRAAVTMLERKVAAVVHVPYDVRIRSQGLRPPWRPHAATTRAAHDIRDAVIALAHSTWGAPLPAAPRPAPLHPKGSDLRAPEDAPRVAAAR